MQNNSELKEVSSIERELSITVPGESITQELNQAYQRMAQKVRLKGFRPGKVPRYVLEQYYKADVEQEVLERVMSKGYEKAVKTHELQPVAQPKVDTQAQLIAGLDFAFKATVEVKPVIELAKWEGLEIKKTVFTVNDEDIEAELGNMQERQVKIVPVEGRDLVQQGDLAEINFSGTVDGENIQGLNGMSYVVEVGAGRFYKEAEQALVGKKLDESFDVEVTVPEDFRKEEIRGKTAVLQVSPQGLKTKEKPVLDDEFAKDVSDEFETLADLKKAIRESLDQQATQRTDGQLREAIVDQLIEHNTFEVPQSLVEQNVEQMVIDQLSRFPQEQAEQIWQMQGPKMKEESRPKALRQVRASLLLETLVSKLEIKFTKKELDALLKGEAEKLGVTVKKYREFFKGDRIKNFEFRMQGEKAIDQLIEKANVSEDQKSIRDGAIA
jgi:trigger factor